MFTISSKMPEIGGTTCAQRLQIRENGAAAQRVLPGNVYVKSSIIWRSFKILGWICDSIRRRNLGRQRSSFLGGWLNEKSEYSETEVSNLLHSLLGKSKQPGQQISYNLLIIYVCLSAVLKMRLIPHFVGYKDRCMHTFLPFYLVPVFYLWSPIFHWRAIFHHIEMIHQNPLIMWQSLHLKHHCGSSKYGSCLFVHP